MVEEEQGKGKGFRVVDRRRFNPEGEARADAEVRPEPAQPAEPPRQEPPRAAPRQDPRAQAPRPEPRQERGPADAHHIDFMSFVASLATNALAALGAIPEARAQGIPVNPDMAREYIDIIAMLQDKTRGNLSREEDGALQRLLAELRMHYVELSKRPPR